MNILAVDIGGTHVKFRTQKRKEPVKLESGSKMTPEKMMQQIGEHTAGWEYDHVTLGFPGPVIHNKPLVEPSNLGEGWVDFDFEKAFDHRPLRIVNDAAMQALGSYRGGRMLFLGLGTGLGSAMVVDDIAQAMELAHMPWRKGRTYEDCLGVSAIKRDGKKTWRKSVLKVIEELGQVLKSDYIALGGGNAKLLKDLPKNVILGSNDNAFKGAFLLWHQKHQGSR